MPTGGNGSLDRPAQREPARILSFVESGGWPNIEGSTRERVGFLELSRKIWTMQGKRRATGRMAFTGLTNRMRRWCVRLNGHPGMSTHDVSVPTKIRVSQHR